MSARNLKSWKIRKNNKEVKILKISVTFGSDDNIGSSSRSKKSIHKKPWFWLLIILVASVAVKMTSRNQFGISFTNNKDDDVSSAFTFEPKSENFTVKEDNDETEVSKSEEENHPVNNVDSTQNLVNENEEGKSVFHFILNVATKKYHTKECSAVKKLAKEKRMDTDIEADSLKEAKDIIESQGYGLCGICDR